MLTGTLILVTSVAPLMFALTALPQLPAPFITHQLRPNVYYIEGGGGHSGVIVGDNGVIDTLGEKPPPPAAPGDGHPPFPTFTETTYQELTAKKAS